MTGERMEVDRASLDRVVQQIVEQFHPERIIFFGSHAYGRPTPDSDVDLLVVLDTPERHVLVAAKIAAAVDHPFPMDLIVHTPAESDAAFRRRASFVTEVLTRGVVLY